MLKRFYASDIDKIASSKLNSAVGNINVKGKDGATQALKGAALKRYLRDKVRGGKTMFTLENKLRQEGVVMGQALKRKRLISTIGGGDKPSLHEMKVAQKMEARKKLRMVQQSKISAELMGDRSDPMGRVFGGKTMETSDHIGVQRQTGQTSILAGSGSAGVQSGNNQQAGVSVGSTVGPSVGIGQSGQQAQNASGGQQDPAVKPGQTDSNASNKTVPGSVNSTPLPSSGSGGFKSGDGIPLSR